jgi:hypothetical protein
VVALVPIAEPRLLTQTDKCCVALCCVVLCCVVLCCVVLCCVVLIPRYGPTFACSLLESRLRRLLRESARRTSSAEGVSARGVVLDFDSAFRTLAGTVHRLGGMP